MRGEVQRKRIEAIAADLGFAGVPELLADMYPTMALHDAAEALQLSTYTLRRMLDEAGIPVRSKGGRNHLYVEMTKELLEELARDGVPAVANRLGVSRWTLYSRLRELRARSQR